MSGGPCFNVFVKVFLRSLNYERNVLFNVFVNVLFYVVSVPHEVCETTLTIRASAFSRSTEYICIEKYSNNISMYMLYH